MKTYDRVKSLLETIPATRNSDKVLFWEFYKAEHKVEKMRDIYGSYHQVIRGDVLMSRSSTSFESISRARRKVQEDFPDLLPNSSEVNRRRKRKQDTKGTFIYREDLEKGIYE